MSDRLERDVRFVKRYAAVTSILLIVLAGAAFTRQARHARSDEITVERINVVEKDGKLRMVISNRERSPGPISRGKPFGYPGGTRPGMIFFNDEGSENGGLTFTGRRLPGGAISASTGMSFDQYNQDQVVTLQYTDNNGNRRMGLSVADRADVPIYDLILRRDSINSAHPPGAARDAALKVLMDPTPGTPLMAPRVWVGRDVARNAS
jgi:hypothetical protein